MLEVLLVEDDDKDARILEGYLERFAAETGTEIRTERMAQAVSLLEADQKKLLKRHKRGSRSLLRRPGSGSAGPFVLIRFGEKIFSIF